MDAVAEQDLELLEQYLDDALAPADVERLHARLVDELALAAALHELRGDRATRSAVFASLEPSEAETRSFADRVSTAARKQARRSRVWQYSRFGSAAAACLLVGFFAGWLGRDRGGDPRATFGPASVNQVAGSPANPPVVATEYPPTPNLGVLISEIRYVDRQRHSTPMLVVRRVVEGSPAAASGLREGDLLLSLDGEPVRDVPTLAAALSSHPGTRVLRVVREGKVGDLSIELHQP